MRLQQMCQHSTMNMIHEVSPDLLNADPGFVYPEKVYMLLEHNSFFQLLHPFNTLAIGRVHTLQETELGWILAGHIQQTRQLLRGGRKQIWCIVLTFLGSWRVPHCPQNYTEVGMSESFPVKQYMRWHWETCHAVTMEVWSWGSWQIIWSSIV